jgi:ribosomal protein S18 acetylase RimI-like enzyme
LCFSTTESNSFAMSTDLVVQPVDNPDDFTHIFHCFGEAFGRQTRESIWLAMNPHWESPQGQKHGAHSLLKRWQLTTRNKNGQPNTVILKATLPDPHDKTKPKIVGAAIWWQASFVDGYGDSPSDSPGAAALAALTPTEQRFASQMYRSLWQRRVSYACEKAMSPSPAIFILDICAVDPAFQRRGIGEKLVQWGLKEAKHRGGLECTTEASSMGRSVYQRLGFEVEGSGEDILYELDEEFSNRDKPPIVFLRTWAPGRALN